MPKHTLFSSSAFSRKALRFTVFSAAVGFSAAALGQPTPSPTPIPSTAFDTAFFNWAERTYPQVFPSGPSNWVIPPFTLRSYSTGHYLGIADNKVYLFGPLTNGQLLDLGATSLFTCKVTPNTPECVHFALVANASSYYNSTYTKEECVKDTNSGLTWEGKPTSGQRAANKTYTNYDSNSPVPAAQINASTNALAYKNYLNFTTHCGYNDWRLPTVEELKTLANEIAPGGVTPDLTWFPNTQNGIYWSSTPNDTTGLAAWEVGFSNDHLGATARSTPRYLRLVRDGGPYSVTGVTASRQLIAGEEATFTIKGKLPANDNLNITMSGAGCSALAYENRSSTEHTFTCTPVTAGSLVFTVRTAPAGQTLGDHALPVSPARYSLVPQANSGTYSKEECVKDNLTGLTWEGKKAAFSDDYRMYDRTYTNYDNTQSPQIGQAQFPTQAQIEASTNSIGYINYVNFLGLCGYSDWRLPSLDELKSLVDTNYSYPTINSTWFPNTTTWEEYLSSTPEPGNPLRVFGVGFSNGDTTWRLVRSNRNAIRLVR